MYCCWCCSLFLYTQLTNQSLADNQFAYAFVHHDADLTDELALLAATGSETTVTAFN